MPRCNSTSVWGRVEASSQQAATQLQLKPVLNVSHCKRSQTKAMQRALHGACLASCGRGHIQGRFRFRISAQAQCPPCPQRTHQNFAGLASAVKAQRVLGRFPPNRSRHCRRDAEHVVLERPGPFRPSRRSSRVGSAGVHTDQRVNASERLKVCMSRKPRWEHVSAGFACCSRVPAKPSMFIQGVSRAVGRAACGSTNRSASLASREITALLVSVSWSYASVGA